MKRNPKVQVVSVVKHPVYDDPILESIRKTMRNKFGDGMGYLFFIGKVRINRKVYGFNGHAHDEMEMLTKGTKEAVRWYRAEHGLNRYDCKK